MFSAFFRSTLVALVASAVAVSAAPGLQLALSGADKVDGLNNLKIIATVTNTGDETLKVLNDPRGPLSQMPTETFAISHDSGAVPAFTGVRVKYVPSVAAKVGKEDAFTILAPGESINVEHDLSAAYNFTSSGAGQYSFAAVNRFHFVDPETGAPVELYADQPDAHVASVSGPLSIARRSVTKRETYTGMYTKQYYETLQS
ncbi:hypothetical protein PHLCEN_2v2748 [Hermanssonia centrifuga]|uniref:Uncharacterized protein n=1 Tax=Hermanssonia centrifuga TaxID=98765 RepID=A0A2R6RHT7_9APHY|nr:hypothetical protein PHLCEN_2v2748 [Hermanssonia centrifuga]